MHSQSRVRKIFIFPSQRLNAQSLEFQGTKSFWYRHRN